MEVTELRSASLATVNTLIEEGLLFLQAKRSGSIINANAIGFMAVFKECILLDGFRTAG